MVRLLGSSYSFWSLFSFHSDSCLHWSAMFCALVSHLSLSELLPNTRCSFPLASILFSKRTAEGRMKEHKEDNSGPDLLVIVKRRQKAAFIATAGIKSKTLCKMIKFTNQKCDSSSSQSHKKTHGLFNYLHPKIFSAKKPSLDFDRELYK